MTERCGCLKGVPLEFRNFNLWAKCEHVNQSGAFLDLCRHIQGQEEQTLFCKHCKGLALCVFGPRPTAIFILPQRALRQSHFPQLLD